jgi:hypothetical protein
LREPAANGDAEEIRDAVRQLVRGRCNAVGSVTLTANVTTTVVSAPFVVNAGSEISLMPTTANAAGALATLWIVPVKDSFTINHASTATTDRTFRWSARG